MHARSPAALALRLAAATVALLVSTHAPGAQEPCADILFEKAVALHQAGDYLAAVKAYKATLAAQPKRIDALSNLGAVYVRLGRSDEAVAQYQAALRLDPANAPVRFNLALAFYKMMRVREAAEELERVVKIQPRNRDAVLLLADCNLQMGHDDQVVALLSPHQADYGDDRLFTYLLGTALIRRNDLERGQKLIDRLLRDPNSAVAHLLLGAAYAGREEYREALPEVQRAVTLDRDLPTAHALLGTVLLGNRRPDEAAAAFRQELEHNPNDFESNLQLGLFAQQGNRLGEAMTYLKRAAQLRPESASVLYGMSRVHLATEDLEAAREDLEALTAKAPDYMRGHVLLTKVYYRLNLLDKAEQERAIVDKLRVEQEARDRPTAAATEAAPNEPAPAQPEGPPPR